MPNFQKSLTPVLCVVMIMLLSPGIQMPQSQEEGSDEKEYKVTFIELGSVRCIPCRKMQKVMDQIEEAYGDQVKIIFYDVWTDEGKPFGAKYKIRLIPTQIFLDKDGEEYFRHEGFFPKEELEKVLKKKGVT